MTNYLPVAENRPIDVIKNSPSKQLGQRCRKGKWIRGRELEELARKKYFINGRGITFSDVVDEYRCSKAKAQLRIKNACKEKIDENGKKSSILFTLDNERTIPQQYFPSCLKATIIENKRNRLIATTGVSYSNQPQSLSHYPLHNAIENQIVQSFLLQLSILPGQPLNMHNVHLWSIINKNHYNEIFLKPWPFNETKVQVERIGLREVVYKFHKKGSIEIIISCSKYPFPLETDIDVNNVFVFLGEVKDRLARILSDPRERIVPPVDIWILKYCDFNKDIELDDKNIGQLMDLNIQIKHAGKAFRLYVKNLEDRFVVRGERIMKVNQPITFFMNNAIQTPLHLVETKLNEFANILHKELKEINNKIENLEKEIKR